MVIAVAKQISDGSATVARALHSGLQRAAEGFKAEVRGYSDPMDPYERQMIDSIRLQVRVELTEHEMLQTELSAAVGVGAAAMNRYLMGYRTFPMPTFIKVAEAFGMTPSELIGKAEARVAHNQACDAERTSEAELAPKD